MSSWRREPQDALAGLLMRRSGWFAVALFALAYAISFLDRQVVSLLVEPLKRDLVINDTQIGLLQGPAFGIIYALFGLPLGWLADRVHRPRLIAAAIALWSAMTVASGLASNFHELLLARVGVGIGEATLVPAAVALLAGLFEPSRRALPLAVFTSGLSVGLGLALAFGSALIAYTTHGVAELPLIGSWLATQRPWQAVFILAGLTGLPVAAMVLLVAEPRTRGAPTPEALQSVAAAIGHIRRHRHFFVPMLAAMAGLYLVSNAFAAWMPSLFIRQLGWTATQVGATLGLGIMACALIGNVGSGLLTAALFRHGQRDAPLRTMLIGASVLIPAAALMPWAGTSPLAIGGALLVYLATALAFGIATTAFVEVTPAPIRSQVIALYLLIGNLAGLGLGPPSVGMLIDYGRAPFNQIGPALSLVCTVVGVPSLWLLYRSRRAYAC
jgi:MFS family permease